MPYTIAYRVSLAYYVGAFTTKHTWEATKKLFEINIPCQKHTDSTQYSHQWTSGSGYITPSRWSCKSCHTTEKNDNTLKFWAPILRNKSVIIDRFQWTTPLSRVEIKQVNGD